METLDALHQQLNSLVWGPPMMVLLMGAGVVFTIVTGGIQFRKLAFSFALVFGRLKSGAKAEGTVTPFQALSTALASTVGVGNIAGVATAISTGGPGALFWLLVSGVLGMATKFAEIAVSLQYRERDSKGVMRGGAMYILSKGLGLGWLGAIFALLAGLAAFGIGNMVQANSVADAAGTAFGVPAWVTGVVLATATALVIVGGVTRIAEVTQLLIPAMCGFYLLAASVIVLLHIGEIPRVISLVLSSAFEGQAAVGGFTGATVSQAVRLGIARGLFSNEAGLGSAPMVPASAVTDHPARQACYGIVEVFIDTIVVCLLTGFVILSTGVWESGETGAALSSQAFQQGLPGEWGAALVGVALILFAFSTVIGWAFYGETAMTYLFGAKAAPAYRAVWILFVYLGATGSLQVIWSVSDTLNGLMAIPNMIAVLASLPLLKKLIGEFFDRAKAG